MKIKQSYSSNQNVVVDNSLDLSTPQVRGKIIKKVKQNLKGSPALKVEILKKLIEEYTDDGVPIRKSRTSNVPEDLVQKVVAFYNDDEISRTSPNQKDCVIVNVDGKKVKESAKHLMFPIKEVYAMFCDDNPSTQISLSTFYKLRPPNVLSFTKFPHNICCCQIHENLRCSLKSLKNSNDLFSNIFIDNGMHKNFVCEEETTECYINECEICKDGQKFELLKDQIEDINQICRWSYWHTLTREEKNNNENRSPYCNVVKYEKEGTIIELFDDIVSQVPEFLDHEYVKACQAKTCIQMTIDARESDSKMAVIMCDFAEKFKCESQNEISSAHYGQTPITIFTIAVYHRDYQPMAIISDFEKQTKDCVIPFLDVTFEMLPPTVEEVELWSDNATSQFKNQFLMQSLKEFEAKYNIKIRWNFYAAMHGKSIVDGIGGKLKQFVRQRILSQNLNVTGVKDFYDICRSGYNEGVLQTLVELVDKDEIKRRSDNLDLNKIIKSSKPLKNISKSHSFEIKTTQNGRVVKNQIAMEKITKYTRTDET
jgi:hypothetical protein